LRQPGGRAAGLNLLESFLAERGLAYQRGMSSPAAGETACSRLSPHLAFGTLSMREVFQAAAARRDGLGDLADGPARRRWQGALGSLIGRLHWHCHFVQKLESQPSIETTDFHAAYAGLRGCDPVRLAAWAEGRTGWPFVDACMRYLAAGGWLNFRMRAMLMAVASYQLWQDWRPTGLHLARLFTDYEPGIHWSQAQMQSGTTGINTVRIYNPVKQGQDQDPTGAFVRRWVPELAAVPLAHLHTPWAMPAAVQAAAGCRLGRDYPAPILDHVDAARAARERVWAVRRGPAFAAEAVGIQARHGSRRSGLVQPADRRKAARRAPGRQLDLGL
jgi:deoxyribodipyrimidine photo-lyase